MEGLWGLQEFLVLNVPVIMVLNTFILVAAGVLWLKRFRIILLIDPGLLAIAVSRFCACGSSETKIHSP